MCVKFEGSKFRSFILILVIHISTFITMSGVLLVEILLMDILILFHIYRRKFFNFRFVFSIGIAIFILLLIFYNSPIVNVVVYSFLGKTTSLSSRLSIWNITLEYIYKNPIIGYGRQSTEFRQLMYHNVHAVNAHNMWLEIIYQGGFFAFGSFISLVCIVGKRINKYKDSYFVKLWLVTFFCLYFNFKCR